jgi:hypothetical protein
MLAIHEGQGIRDRGQRLGEGAKRIQELSIAVKEREKQMESRHAQCICDSIRVRVQSSSGSCGSV